MALKPAALHRVDQLLGDHRIAPCGFTALGFERVAEVPAESDLTGHLRCRRQRLAQRSDRQHEHGHTDEHGPHEWR